MKKSLKIALSGLVLTVGCASDPAPKQEVSESLTLGTAFYGLTIKDCYATATDCVETAPADHTWVQSAATCRTQLHVCLGDMLTEAAGTIVQEAHEITKCGQGGLSCYGDARHLSEALDCRNGVEVCVNTEVENVTGIELPTSREVVTAAVDTAHAAAEHAAETAHEVAVTAVDTAHAAAEHAVDTAHAVVEHAENTAGYVVEGAVGTAEALGGIAATAVHDTAAVAIHVVGEVTAPARNAVECALEAQDCLWDTKELFTCREAYRSCLLTILDPE